MGFGALARRVVERVAADHASAVGGVLSTVTQVAIVAGVAVLGTLYFSVSPRAAALPALTWILVVIAAGAALASATVRAR